MWDETKRVFLTSSLERLLESDNADFRAYAENEIARRRADERYAVTVRHVGSRANPLRYDELVAEEDGARVLARARAVAALRSVTSEPGAELLDEVARADPVWRRAMGESCKRWIVEGLVGGEDEYHRLLALGFSDGGAPAASSLLVHATQEVRRFQEVPADAVKSGQGSGPG